MKIASFVCLLATVTVAHAQNITSGLLAHYTFEGTPNDVSGNGNHATPSGLYQYPTAGLVGSALRISGDGALFYSGGGHINIPTFGATLNSGFTVSLWTKDEDLGGSTTTEENYITFGILDQPTCGILLISGGRVASFYISAGAGGVTRTIPKALSVPSDLGTWKHFVMTYTPGKFTAYYNGAKVGEELVTVNVFPVTKAALGRHWWSGGAGSSARMSATFDNVRIYNRALTEADVQQVYVTDAVPALPLPTIVAQPVAQTVIEQQSTTFRVTAASATPLLYQWRKNDVPIPGALDSTYAISAVRGSDAGAYSVVITNAAGSVVSSGATLTVAAADPGRLINLSTLGSGGFTMGFVVAGTSPKNMLVRAVGPTLTTLGVAGASTQTSLTLYNDGKVIAANSRWGTASNSSQIAAVPGPFALPAGSADSAILMTLAPGAYTAQVTSNGAVLLEAYESP